MKKYSILLFYFFLLSGCTSAQLPSLQQNIAISEDKAVVFAKITSSFGKGSGLEWTKFDEFNKPTEKKILMKANEGMEAFIIPQGHYVITTVAVRPEWQANGGLHKITHKPLYGDFTVEAGDAIYVGDIALDTDGNFYKGSAQGSGDGLGILIVLAVNAASKTFSNEDAMLKVTDNFATLQKTLQTERPDFPRKVTKKLMKPGYWAGKSD